MQKEIIRTLIMLAGLSFIGLIIYGTYMSDGLTEFNPNKNEIQKSVKKDFVLYKITNTEDEINELKSDLKSFEGCMDRPEIKRVVLELDDNYYSVKKANVEFFNTLLSKLDEKDHPSLGYRVIKKILDTENQVESDEKKYTCDKHVTKK